MYGILLGIRFRAGHWHVTAPHLDRHVAGTYIVYRRSKLESLMARHRIWWPIDLLDAIELCVNESSWLSHSLLSPPLTFTFNNIEANATSVSTSASRPSKRSLTEAQI